MNILPWRSGGDIVSNAVSVERRTHIGCIIEIDVDCPFGIVRWIEGYGIRPCCWENIQVVVINKSRCRRSGKRKRAAASSAQRSAIREQHLKLKTNCAHTARKRGSTKSNADASARNS